MSVLSLLGHLWRRHRLALLWLAAGSGFFPWAITRVVPAVAHSGFVRQLFDMAPAPVRVATGALAGEVGRGTMDLVASRPVSRSAQVAAAWAVVAGLVLIAAAGWA